MWDMEIPPEGQNFGSGTRFAEGGISISPHRYNMKDYFSHITNIKIFGFNLQKVNCDVGKTHNVNITS
jgi:hypothetical protein